MPHPHDRPPRALRVHVVTVSTSRDAGSDRSGPLLRQLAESAGHTVSGPELVPDDPLAIGAALDAALAGAAEVVLLTGGTGVSARDQTPAVVAPRLDRVLPGFGELFRMLSWQEVGSKAMASSAVGGLAGGKPVFALPGSTAACRLAMEKLILPELPHLAAELVKETPLPPGGWRAALVELGGRLGSAAPLPEGLPAGVADVLRTAGAVATAHLRDGDGVVFGFPDFIRPGARVLLLAGGAPDWSLLALHRFPVRVGVGRVGGYLPHGDAAGEAELRTGRATEGVLWGVESAAVLVRAGGAVGRWDGHRRVDLGTPAQALATVALEWSRR